MLFGVESISSLTWLEGLHFILQKKERRAPGHSRDTPCGMSVFTGSIAEKAERNRETFCVEIVRKKRTFGVNQSFPGAEVRAGELLLDLGHVLGVQDVEPALAQQIALRVVENLGHRLGHVQDSATVAAHDEQETLGSLRGHKIRTMASRGTGNCFCVHYEMVPYMQKPSKIFNTKIQCVTSISIQFETISSQISIQYYFKLYSKKCFLNITIILLESLA